jgi:hypothetical protein
MKHKSFGIKLTHQQFGLGLVRELMQEDVEDKPVPITKQNSGHKAWHILAPGRNNNLMPHVLIKTKN